MLDRSEIKACKMKQFQPRRVGQHRFQIGRIIRAVGAEPNQMFIALPIGNLHHAQPVTVGDQPHRFGVDGNNAGGQRIGGQVFFVEMYGHRPVLRASRKKVETGFLQIAMRQQKTALRKKVETGFLQTAIRMACKGA
jgi:hypothetical protein